MIRFLIPTLFAAMILCAAACEPSGEAGVPGAAGEASVTAGAGAAAPGGGTVDDPVVIAEAPTEVQVDGTLDDWAGVPRMPMPAMGGKASSVMFCWSDAGLYGAALVHDDSITARGTDPYMADSIEVWIEKDFARAADRTENATQIVFAPAESLAEGEGVVAAYGRDEPRQSQVKCMWKKTNDGYAIEFMIPAKILAPAKLESGTKVGFDFTLNDDGKPVERFVMNKDDDQAFRKPDKWGAAVLK